MKKRRCFDEYQKISITVVLILVISVFMAKLSYIDNSNYLDMRTVVDFEAVDNGIILYTEDGSGYYFEH